MTGEPDISLPARAIGDPARARILTALMGGAQRPATELARAAGVAGSTASGHLHHLLDAGLVSVERHGRHRYYRLSGPDVARAIESLQALGRPTPVSSLRQHRVASDLRAGRTCYDHLAGDLGLRVAGLLHRSGVVADLEVGRVSEPPSPFPANEVVAVLGLGPRGRSRRPWARGCLDWTARRPHVAGQLGAQVLEAFQHHRWLTGRPGSRAVRLTATGQQALAELESLSH